MIFTRQRRLSVPICTLLAFTLGAAAARGQQDNQQQANDQQATQEEQAKQQQGKEGEQPADQKDAEKPVPRELRVFELQHRNPAEIQQLLGMRTASPLARQGVIVGRASRPSELDEGPMAAVAGDADSKTLFVRGTAAQIQKIEEIVKAVDVPADQFKAQTIGDKHLIPISGDGTSTQRVLNTLSQLQLPHQAVQIGKGALVVISDDGSGEFQSLTEQTQQVITALQKSQQAEQQKQAADAAAQQQQNSQDGGEKKE